MIMFDLSSVLNQATEVANRESTNEGSGRKYPRIIYPGNGTLRVKLLYNPKSNLVARQLNRHKIGGTNYTCLKTYGQDCPICKTLENIKNSTGNDLWQCSQKFRGLTYAQYVGSERYSWSDDNKEPQVGEVILLMYPWSVYQDINRIISMAGANASQLIAENEGKVCNIVRWTENDYPKYKCEVEPFNPASFKSAATEEEFMKFMNDLPNLNETIAPAEFNSDVYKAANDAAESLSREYLSNSISSNPNPMTNGGGAQTITTADGRQFILVNGQYVPINQPPVQQSAPIQQGNPPMNPPIDDELPFPSSTPSTPTQSNPQQSNASVNQTIPEEHPFPNDTPGIPIETPVSTAGGQQLPECYGQHNDNDNKCLSCVYEIQCMVNQQ